VNAPPLVLGPALGTSAATLWGDCAALLARDVDVVAWDLPGHGGDRSTVGPGLRMEDLADQVLGRVDGPFHYAGVSVGGAVGLQLLLQAPERVRSAVLLCTGARVGTPERWRERIQQVRRSGTPSLVTASAQRWFAPGFVERQPARASALLHALSDTDDSGYTAVCGALAAFDVRSRLGEITTPVLAVAGAHDSSTPPAVLGELADGVRDGRLVVLPDVGHLPPAEAPETVADLVRQHVMAHDTGTHPNDEERAG